jgi:hypothetical protein
MGKNKGAIWHTEFTKDGRELTLPEIGLKLIATVDPRGWPHLTMISFNIAKTQQQVVWGQFTEGLSKKYVTQTKKQGMFFMTAKPPFKFIQAKVEFDYLLHSGEDCENFSRGKMLRYMTYTNVHTCFYNKVIGSTEIRNLPLSGIIKGFIAAKLGLGGVKSKQAEEKLNDFGFEIHNQMTSAKAIAYIDTTDGFPIIIPCFQMRAPDKNKLAFPFAQFKEDLEKIPIGSHVATYCTVSDNLELMNLMINGRLTEVKKVKGIKWGIIEIDEIYNSMPPLPGVIYPAIEVRPKVTQFPAYIPDKS